jgi:DNA-binding MarR family transcriptional regulator
MEQASVQIARDLRVIIGRLRRRLREGAGGDDLTPSQTSVLIRLNKDGPASASGLAAAERVRPQSMAVVVAALDRAGLIRRDPDPEDGRRQLLSLTPEGRDRAAGGWQAREEWLAQAVQERYTEEERRTIAAALALMDRLDRP